MASSNPLGLPPGFRPLFMLIANESGAVALSGPVDDKVQIYGLIEVAKDCARDHHARKAREQQIQTAPARLLDILDGPGSKG